MLPWDYCELYNPMYIYIYIGDKSKGMVKKERLTKEMKWKKGYRNFQLSVILHFKAPRNR